MPIAIKTIYIWVLKLGARIEMYGESSVKIIFESEMGDEDFFIVHLNLPDGRY